MAIENDTTAPFRHFAKMHPADLIRRAEHMAWTLAQSEVDTESAQVTAMTIAEMLQDAQVALSAESKA